MIGPALPSQLGAGTATTRASESKPSIGCDRPQAPQTARRATIGPAAPPVPTATSAAVRRFLGPAAPASSSRAGEATRVNVAGRGSVPSTSSRPATPDSAAVARCRAGELPPRGWGSQWSSATKRAALIAAVEAGQMHVVYMLCPASATFQASVDAVVLEQADLDRLLRDLAMGKRKVPKARADEAMAWLLESGACLEALCRSELPAERNAAAVLLASSVGGQGFSDRVHSVPDDGQEPGNAVAAARAASLLESSDWQTRATAADAFALMAKSVARPHAAALAKLLLDAQAVVRSAAIVALGHIGSAAASACAEVLVAQTPRAREAAAEALGKIGSGAAAHAEALACLLEDSDWQVPTAAANALSRIGDVAAPEIAKVLARCEQPSKAAASEALARIGGAAAADAAAGLLACGEAGVRRHAADILAALGSDAARPHLAALTALSADADKEVRQAVLTALTRLGARSALPPVIGNGDDLPDFGAAASSKGRSKGSGKSAGKTCANEARNVRRPRSRSRSARNAEARRGRHGRDAARREGDRDRDRDRERERR
eukprot:TRINITY_DN12288_c0_g1_i2.p1 TRINITY_DN12288_c0_g1~~TRINITY_DN12288_c0_g1_i2.p1  ORF type:complete len:551 (+),score=106.28 TRINITY_DN12288_c0_g1_i2:192-1844(+)